MEKAMSVEERIKKAEERYNRKNNYIPEYNLDNAKSTEKIKNANDKNKKLINKKLIMQIFIAIVIYVSFYAISNRDYVFSDDFRNDVNDFLKNKTRIYEIYINSKKFLDSKFSNIKAENTNTLENEVNTNQIENNANNEISKENSENIGGAEETQESPKSQMEIDAEYVKSKLKFINPIEGKITSTFGWRNPTVSTVPKYHTGLDIANVAGTKIKSATDGKIILASSKGDYGNHYKIQIDNITLIYAHCKKLYLNKGDNVYQGQEIGEVGSTGNSTGPHLHFEIRVDNRKVDPQMVLNI